MEWTVSKVKNITSKGNKKKVAKKYIRVNRWIQKDRWLCQVFRGIGCHIKSRCETRNDHLITTEVLADQNFVLFGRKEKTHFKVTRIINSWVKILGQKDECLQVCIKASWTFIKASLLRLIHVQIIVLMILV